uniref:Glutathione peroxidase n=1 Tax=Rhodosorus marinus TaxID=101924 RepID=A0A7S0G287_9RHOD|mmetsp:Transcript_16477/g.23825  ORF Transcript_16477/g.23825 Transcript_16477/m.23825 type:complete len:203 (+) Transcript_16477:393-1001(+)
MKLPCLTLIWLNSISRLSKNSKIVRSQPPRFQICDLCIDCIICSKKLPMSVPFPMANIFVYLLFVSGKVVFAINVASKDSKSEKFYRLLVDLHDRYHAQGLEILAFPCNCFDQRELAGNEEVKKYVQEKYGVEFTMMAKSFLDYNPVFCLGHKSFPGEIVWNFYGMFIFDREGNAADRIPADAPEELIELKIQEVLERPHNP